MKAEFNFKPRLPIAATEWTVTVRFNPVTRRLDVESKGLPSAKQGIEMLREALKFAEQHAAGQGATGLVGANGAPLVKEGLSN